MNSFDFELEDINKSFDQNCSTAIIYHELYDGRGFSRLTRSWNRYRAGLDKLRELGLLAPEGQQSSGGQLLLHSAREATEDELATVHSPAYIEYVREMDAKGEGFFDRMDTPAWHGVFRRAAMAAGGTLVGAELIGQGKVKHAFHPAGGLHHAKYEKASGFCIFNDIVLAVRRWQNHYGLKRIAILDVDGHHGDGTQSLLYNEKVLTVSLHQYDGRFFPGTGALGERGEGPGLGYSLNLPLPRYTTDEDYFRALEIALLEIESYRPEALIVQYGVDGHFSDRMVGLKLSTRVYERVAERAHELAHHYCDGRMLVVGGGGYEPDAVARCWGIMAANLSGQRHRLGENYNALHDPLENLPETRPEVTAQVDRLVEALGQML